ncbi:MAG: sigma-70 family RNA polymerase sigma factor [Sedimentisphaerales bacterium]|nr:sigma-70 family RNA polymerase sigma factor [Sedimentisphaerales bacterium]
MSKSTVEFENLVDKYGKRVLGTAMRVLGDAGKAQDIHQEVFLSIWKSWHKFNGEVINWGGYLYRATVRKAVELAKKDSGHSLQGRNPKSLANNVTAEMNLKADELRQNLAKIIAQLSERQADVFIMSRLEGLENDKIAEILGCSPETVRVHLHRALKFLASKLTEYFPQQQAGTLKG